MKIRRILSCVMAAAVMITALPLAYALDGNSVDPWERSAETHRENLKNSIGYIEAMDKSVYTDESVKALSAAIETAKKEYDDAEQSAKDYYKARNQLEYARAKLVYKQVGEDGPNKLPFRELSTEEVIAEMGAGINYGNALDGHNSMVPSETAWQPREATKAQVQSMHDGGYNTIRMPVTWGKKIKKDEATGEYTIDEAWLSRVQEVVDYAISQGMYVIINVHHDGVNWSNGWFNIGNNDIDEVMEKFAAVWKIIAERFKDYDEHLIFESMNEMTAAQKDGHMWDGGAFDYDVDILRNLNQLFVNTVRSTGSNNTKRWLASKGHFATTGKTVMPEDPMNEGVSHQMYAAHIYNSVENRYKGIKELADNYKSLGCPLILGEWTTYTGSDGSTETGYNDVEKAFQSEMVYRYAKVNNVCAVAWDIGVFEQGGKIEGGNASYWSREDLKPGFQSVLRAVMRAAYLPLTDENKTGDLSDVYAQYGLDPKKGVDQHPKTVSESKITEISCEDSVTLTVGDVKTITPTFTVGTNDVLVWTTSDDSVAVVSNGRITAKKAGTATVTAYAINTVEYGYYGNYNDDPYANAVKKEITVTVNNKSSSAKISGSDEASLFVKKSAQLDLTCDGVLTYSSDNEEVVTVNAVGRVFGKSEGTATVTATADNGETKTVKVTVNGISASEEDEYINVGIFVLYNDEKHGYWDNEIGETIKVYKPGIYTLTYDMAKHQTDASKEHGITDINNLTAIYLKDIDVHSGDIEKSAFRYCKIQWNYVKINGEKVKFLDGKTTPFNSINKSGVFDSGRPVNSWEGNDIEGVEVNDHTAVFTDIENPTSVTICFTVTQIMLNSKPVSYYVDLVLEQAAELDRDELSKEEEEELDGYIEKLKELYADASTPEQKLLTAYSKVRAFIDDRLPPPPPVINEESSTAENSTDESTASSADESAGADSSTAESITDNNDGGNGIVIIIIAAAAVVIAGAAAVIIIKKKKTDRSKK